MDKPTYTFAEIIEHIRWAVDPEETVLIGQVVEEELDRYCPFHARLIVEAFRQKKLLFQRLSYGDGC